MPRDNSNVIKNGKEGFNMNEVEKLYENAEPNRNCNLYKHFTECPMKHTQCEDCENFVYSPFTAEKQLELIKWIACNKINECKNIDFGEALAELINSFWQSLTEEDKQQIKEILE